MKEVKAATLDLNLMFFSRYLSGENFQLLYL
jgi:hypothetical protein